MLIDDDEIEIINSNKAKMISSDSDNNSFVDKVTFLVVIVMYYKHTELAFPNMRWRWRRGLQNFVGVTVAEYVFFFFLIDALI